MPHIDARDAFDFEALVLGKLVPVVGPADAADTLAAAKAQAGMQRIVDAQGAVAISRILAGWGGFVGIVGDLLLLEIGERWGTA